MDEHRQNAADAPAQTPPPPAPGAAEQATHTFLPHAVTPDEATQAYVGPSPAVAAGLLPAGTLLGKYRVNGLLGRGGMGVVYEAEDMVIGRQVAVKLLPDTLAANKDAMQRFLREARSAGKLNHPNVVMIHDVDQRSGACFIIMELVRGGSAQDRLAAQGPFPWREATRVTADACRGLAAAHAQGLIHRDLKPHNIMLADDGTVKLADFGLAKAADADLGMTQTGVIIGTPHYMSPEQCRGEAVDARSDVYALAAAYYTLLTGRTPFAELATAMQVMYSHCYKPLPDPRQYAGDIPDGCWQVIRKAMEKDPADRYQSAADFLADLEAVLAGAPPAHAQPPARPPVVEPAAPTPRPSFWRRMTWRQRAKVIAAALVVVGLWIVFGRDDSSKRSTFRATGGGSNLDAPRSADRPRTFPKAFVNSIGMKLVRIEPGEFLMGDADEDDAPPHPVRITKPFYIGAYEVTTEQFRKLMGRDLPRVPVPPAPPEQGRASGEPTFVWAQGEKLPLMGVTWSQAMVFCKRLSTRGPEMSERRVYRLPTEAEWEYACRAGTTSEYSFGDKVTRATEEVRKSNFLLSDQINNLRGRGGVAMGKSLGPQPVTEGVPNAWGLHYMHGNAGEWCLDWYDPDYYRHSPSADPQGPTDKPREGRRVIRGGSYATTPNHGTSASRGHGAPDERRATVGVRVVCEVGGE